MIYINPEGEYPRHIGDIQLASPGWNLGHSLPEGWVQVIGTNQPEVLPGQTLVELPPVQVGSDWVQAFEVRDLTAEEINRNAVAAIRNKVARRMPITQEEALKLVG